MRRAFFATALLLVAGLTALSLFFPWAALGFVVVGPLVLWGLIDAFQKGSNIRRTYPIGGTLLELLKMQRHVPQEDLLQTSWEGRPFSWLQQRLVAKRATKTLMNEAFGTELDYDAPGHEWLRHALYPTRESVALPRVRIGEGLADAPYDASLFNVSALSFGAVSANAIEALCAGAKKGGFAVNTGEGGLTDHHLEAGCDIIFQFGTGYFGCRTEDGRFDPEKFAELVREPAVRMVEIKISQGAKPGFGAVLPASKNTEEVARYRALEPHTEVISPPHHEEFGSHEELLDFIGRLRELSGGKPVGIKLCLGNESDFDGLCAAMTDERRPDYVVVAGGEGGTGAGELDSIHHVGGPTERNLVHVDAALRRHGRRDQVKVLVAGKIISGFDVARAIALGADACYSARGMMFALGCVQALKCNTNRCPTGITTMDPAFVAGLVPSDKAQKVASYHEETLKGLEKILVAAGLRRPDELTPELFQRRVAPGRVVSLAVLHDLREAAS